MLNNLMHPRIIFLGMFLVCAGLLITAMYIEPFASMEACPMCMMQRVVFGLLGMVAILAALHLPQGVGLKIYSGLLSAISILGASIAGRQVWLQNLPKNEIPECGPGWEYMLDVFPLMEVIQIALRGTGDCAEVQWSFLGVSIPGWSVLAFSGMALAGLYVLFFKTKPAAQ